MTELAQAEAVERLQRAAVVAEANTWLGTPFHHMGRLKGVGVDCGQLLALVYPQVLPVGEIDPGKYSMQYMLHCDAEQYIEQILKYAKEIPEEQAAMGDIVLYKCGRTFSHSGIILDRWPGEIINAVVGCGVCYLHGTKDGFVKQRKRRFFSPWAK